jgi:hypothetical protein
VAELPSRYMASVDHTGLLRRSPRCSVITQRARVQQRPSQRPPPFLFMCRLVLCGSSAGQSRRKNGLPHPGREQRGWLHAGGEKRGHLAAPGRQTKWGGCRKGPLASDMHYALVRSVTGEPRRRLEHKIALHKAANEVRYIVIFNNGSPTEPNGVRGESFLIKLTRFAC